MAQFFQTNLGYIAMGQKQKTTALTTPRMYIPYLDENVKPVYEEVDLAEGGQGLYQGETKQMKTRKGSEVEFSTYLYPRTGAEILGGFMGKSTFTATLPTTTNIHTLAIVTTDCVTTPAQKWLTIEKNLVGTKVMRAQGVKISSVTLEGETGQPVKITAEGVGMDMALATTAGTDTYESDNPFMFYNGTYKGAGVGYTTTTFDVTSFNVKLNVNNDEDMQTVGFSRQDIVRQTLSGEVTIGVYFKDYDNWVKANMGLTTSTAGLISTSYQTGTLDIDLAYGTLADKRSIHLKIPEMKLMPHEQMLNNSPETMQTELSGLVRKKNTTTAFFEITAQVPLTTSLPW